MKKIGNSLTDRLCYLDTHCFIKHINYTTLTQDKYIHSKKWVIDTTLIGYEFVTIQHLLAHSINISPPITGNQCINYGISVLLSRTLFQAFEKIT